jgi:predicted transcriptional regulator
MNKMTGEEIAKELGISRQAVSNSLKRIMEKLFIETRKLYRWKSDFEVAVIVLEKLHCFDSENMNDVKKDFHLFPPKIRKRIEDSAKDFLRKCNQEEDADEEFIVDEVIKMFM